MYSLAFGQSEQKGFLEFGLSYWRRMGEIAILVVAVVLIVGLRWATRSRAVIASEPAWVRDARKRQEWRLTPVWLRSLMYLGVITFFAGIFMFESASRTNPRHRDEATGHVYSLNNHGSVAYVTKADYARIEGAIWGGWGIAAAAMLTAKVKQRKWHPPY
jgi:hypothetical protein